MNHGIMIPERLATWSIVPRSSGNTSVGPKLDFLIFDLDGVYLNGEQNDDSAGVMITMCVRWGAYESGFTVLNKQNESDMNKYFFRLFVQYSYEKCCKEKNSFYSMI